MPEQSTSRIITVNTLVAPQAGDQRAIDTLLIIGDTDVIDGSERFKTAANLNGVANHGFSVSDPEYVAASRWFGQNPQPTNLMIGRWLRTATAGKLNCGLLSTAEQAALVTSLQAISDGSLNANIDAGGAGDETGLDFNAITDLNDAATVLSGITGATCAWNATDGRFVFKSDTTGASSSVSLMTTAGSGTDVSALIKADSAGSATAVSGYDAETAQAAVVALRNKSTDFAALTFDGSSVQPAEADIETIATDNEASNPTTIFGVTSSNTNNYDSLVNTSLSENLKDANLAWSTICYSQVAAAQVGALARGMSTDYDASNSVNSLKFDVLAGVAAEDGLTSAQLDTLIARNCNAFIAYNNNTDIYQEGVMCNGDFFDERHGILWFRSEIRAELWDLLYSGTPVPMNQEGRALAEARVAKVCRKAVNNGLIAPGTWNSATYDVIKNGDYLPSGYHIYSEPFSLQSAEDRAARRLPLVNVLAKFRGSAHYFDLRAIFSR